MSLPGVNVTSAGAPGESSREMNRPGKAGIQSNAFVREFGLRLLPELYEIFNPLPYEGACAMEVELAIGLREAGYGVWQA